MDDGRATGQQRRRAADHAGLGLVGDHQRRLVAADGGRDAAHRPRVVEQAHPADEGRLQRDPLRRQRRGGQREVGLAAEHHEVLHVRQRTDQLLQPALQAALLVVRAQVEDPKAGRARS